MIYDILGKFEQKIFPIRLEQSWWGMLSTFWMVQSQLKSQRIWMSFSLNLVILIMKRSFNTRYSHFGDFLFLIFPYSAKRNPANFFVWQFYFVFPKWEVFIPINGLLLFYRKVYINHLKKIMTAIRRGDLIMVKAVIRVSFLGRSVNLPGKKVLIHYWLWMKL